MYGLDTVDWFKSVVAETTSKLGNSQFHRQLPHSSAHYPEATWTRDKRDGVVRLRQIMEMAALLSWDLLFIAGRVPTTVYSIQDGEPPERSHVLRNGDSLVLETMRSVTFQGRNDNELCVGREDPEYDNEGLYISVAGLSRALTASAGQLDAHTADHGNSMLVVRDPLT